MTMFVITGLRLARSTRWAGGIKSFPRWLQTQTQTPRLSPARRKKPMTEGGYIMLVIPVAAFGLGTWQVQRREWKLNLIKHLESRVSEPAIQLPDDLDEIDSLEYRKVVVRGTFDHSKEMMVGPRTNLHHRPSAMMSSTQSGMHIVTPFKLADRDLTILVNRGWVPSPRLDKSKRPEGQIEGEVELEGVIRLDDAANKNKFFPQMLTKTETLGYFVYRDVDEMAEVAGTAPVFIDADYKSSVPGGPLGGQTRVQLRNEHLSYIITWYSLGAITSWMWYRRYRRPPIPRSAFDLLRPKQPPS